MMVKRAKKRSVSSICSLRNYALCKCILGSLRITIMLVKYSNYTMNQQYHSQRWLKILNVIIEKGKGPVLGKLRMI